MRTIVATVLLVDDHQDSLGMYALGLQMTGFRAVTATSAEEAYAQALALRPDVVVTDVRLPAASGLDLTRRLRAAPETSDAAIVLLTGDGAASIECEAREAGCDRLLLKPIQPDDLSLVIGEVLGARRRSPGEAPQTAPAATGADDWAEAAHRR